MNLTIKTMEKLIEVLELKHDRKGFFNTTWGKKTFEGLRETIENIITEESIVMKSQPTFTAKDFYNKDKCQHEWMSYPNVSNGYYCRKCGVNK